MDIIDILGALGGFAALIMLLFFLYDRFLKDKHRVNVEHGNIVFTKISSKVPQRNNKLALMVYDLKFVNSSDNPLTLKELQLKYEDSNGVKATRPYSVPTGNIEGKQAIALTNGEDQIIAAWENIWEKIIPKTVIQPGGVIAGSALFVLDTPVELVKEINSLSLVIGDYSGNQTEHFNQLNENWLEYINKGFILVDAPVKKLGENIEWEDVPNANVS